MTDDNNFGERSATSPSFIELMYGYLCCKKIEKSRNTRKPKLCNDKV